MGDGRLKRGLWVLALCLVAVQPAEARRNATRSVVGRSAEAPGARRAPTWLRDRALTGKIGWNSYLRQLSRLRPSVFRQERLQLGSPARFRILAENKAQQYAILRDRKALQRVEQHGEIQAEHLLGIPTGRRQPIWLHAIGSDQAGRIGRITRETLEKPRQIHGRGKQTLAYYHLPGNISQPIVHAHGVWRPGSKPRVKSWDRLLRRHYRRIGGKTGYALYQARPDARGLAAEWPIVAVAATSAGPASQMGPRTDALLGKMVLDVARSTLEQGSPSILTRGRIEIDRADRRIAVRLVRRRQPSDTMYW